MTKDNNDNIIPWWLLVIILAAPSGYFFIHSVMEWGSVQNIPLWAWLISPGVGVVIAICWYLKSRWGKNR